MEKLRFLLSFLLALLPLAASAAPPAPVASGGEWYLDNNVLDMTPANRFIGAVNLTNPGDAPIYIRASVRRLELRDGKRVQVDDAGGALRVYPEEFVLQPHAGLAARFVADLAKLQGDVQSYMVKFEDVTNVQAQNSEQKGLFSGYLLAYDVMIAVHRSPKTDLAAGDLTLTRDAGGKLVLTNRSGQHIYLNRGDACAAAETPLAECKPWPHFPRQTMLAGEALTLDNVTTSFLGLLAYPGLNSRRVPNRFYLAVPQ